MKEDPALRFDVGAASDAGLVRQGNEDCVLVDLKHNTFAVSDGMGGHRRGDLASKIAIETLQSNLELNLPLEQAVKLSHQAVLKEAMRNADARNMGATLVVVKVKEGSAEVAWVGDSRVYLFENQKLALVSKDHTYVQELVDAGFISEEEATYHPKRHLLTAALGIQTDAELVVGAKEIPFRAQSTLLLCSDGLTGELSPLELEGVLGRFDLNNQEKADLLVQMTNAAGGRDNVSVVLIQWTSLESSTPSPTDQNSLTHPSIEEDTKGVLP